MFVVKDTVAVCSVRARVVDWPSHSGNPGGGSCPRTRRVHGLGQSIRPRTRALPTQKGSKKGEASLDAPLIFSWLLTVTSVHPTTSRAVRRGGAAVRAVIFSESYGTGGVSSRIRREESPSSPTSPSTARFGALSSSICASQGCIKNEFFIHPCASKYPWLPDQRHAGPTEVL